MDIVNFLILSLICASTLVLLHLILTKTIPKKATKITWTIISAIVILCTIAFMLSIFIGGWTGMGYGLLIIFILVGVFAASIVLLFIKVFLT